jgi:hypothetical protein
MPDGVNDTAVAPVTAATLALPPAAAVLASGTPLPPILLPPPLPLADNHRMIPSLPPDLQKLIDSLVLQRVKYNWPFVRAFEGGRDVSSVQVSEWVAFTFSDWLDYDDKTLVGKVLKVGVYPQTALQADYFKPPEWLLVAVYARVPGTAHFVKWSPVAISAKRVHCSALLAVGFPMQPVEGLRRPSGRRRLGLAFVMDAGVQAQLSSLGPLTEMIP